MKPRNQPVDLLNVAAAVGDGAAVDWTQVESHATPAERDLAGHLRLLERIATVHAGLPPVATFEHSLRDSLLDQTAGVDGAATLAPTKWGPLTIVEKIGRGTYADVYRAVDPRLDRPVALKLLRHRDAADAVIESEAIEEARLLARIRHPNVVTVYGAERIDGRAGIWMELVDGQTVEQELRERGPFAIDELISVGTALCRALQAVHRAGLLHRDVKAQNVMRDRDGRVLLTDFGTGREVNQLGTAGELAGTPRYLAPEVLNGGAASVASDIYSLGVLLYHLATGSFPVSGRSLRDLSDAHARGAHVPLQDARRDLPAKIATAIDGAAAGDVIQRFGSALEFETALVAASRPARSTRGLWLSAAATAAIVVSLVVFAVTRGWFSGPGVALNKFTTTQLTFNDVYATAAAISPDGRYLAYTEAAGLTLRSIATGEQRRVSLAPEVVVTSMAWLPDSDGLFLSGPRGLWRTSRRRLDNPPLRINQAGAMVAVSPDGQHLALTGLEKGHLQVMTIEGEDARDVGGPGTDVTFSRATWSPDGRRIAYQRKEPSPGGQRVTIETCLLDGTGRTVLVDSGRFRSMVWTPDGRIVFMRPLDAPEARYDDVWQVPAHGAMGLPLSPPALLWRPTRINFFQPSLTADGTRLVYLERSYRQNVHLAAFDPVGKTLTEPKWAVLDDIESAPLAWMPQGDSFLYLSYDGIFRQDLDRGMARRINLDLKKGAVLPAVMSPDAHWLLYVKPAGVMRMPFTGGAAETVVALPSFSTSALRCSQAPAQVCVAAELTGGKLRLASFDPVQGKPVGQFDLPAAPQPASWDLSPRGTEVISVGAGRSGRAVLLDLRSGNRRELKSDAWVGAQYASWAADGEGWIVTRLAGERGSEVVYIDRNDRSKMLWTSASQQLTKPMVSPDGRLVAFQSSVSGSAVWMLQHF